ncbi:MAG: substrate-binding domain-containing protein [Chitinophagales bacterium]|nr:substrate-binding domain-containing protein [Chitinophagaceae bacterium]MCB9065219.1 substrate-binding domain-containing protein [Chitinophagales bacterium]
MLFFAACQEDAKKDGPKDTISSGEINISVDETYTPVIKEQIKVFDSSYPEATINASYKPEAECINDFLTGNARLILVTRDLTDQEKQSLESQKVISTSMAVAKDAVAVILNKNADDSVLSISALQGILTGQYKKDYTVVFDGQGSSTLRFMLDSIIPGEKLGKNVFATNSNDSVIQYVANNPNAIGFVGVSHVSDFDDPAGLAFINSIKVASIYNDSLEKAYQPYQAFIAPEWYPLTRKLYYIHKETYYGLATGFSKFLREQRGQLIFKQSRLFPNKVNVIFREAQLND